MALRAHLKLLVVDDMATSRALILNALEGFGISHLDYAEDGVAALQHLNTHPVHLVISDYYMPKMDGLQLLRQIRLDPSLQNIGFILITGRADAQIIDAGTQLGMNNFLNKPFTPVEMRDCIEAVVGKL
jgi:two-component system chemotaxis response regulator CheY